MHRTPRPPLALVRLSFVVLLVGLLPACSWYFGPGDEQDDPNPTTTTTGDEDTTGVEDTTGEPDPDECLTVGVFLERFGACLSFEEWGDANLCALPVSQTDDGSTCASCHTEGEANVQLENDCGRTFRAQRQRPFVFALIEPFSDRDGCYLGFRAGGGKLLAPDLSDAHPSFTLREDIRSGIVDVVNTTVARALDESIDCSDLE